MHQRQGMREQSFKQRCMKTYKLESDVRRQKVKKRSRGYQIKNKSWFFAKKKER